MSSSEPLAPGVADTLLVDRYELLSTGAAAWLSWACPARRAEELPDRVIDPLVGEPIGTGVLGPANLSQRRGRVHGLEGIVARRLSGIYGPGQRGSWVKVKNPRYWRRESELEASAAPWGAGL